MTNRQSRNVSKHWAQDTEQRPTKQITAQKTKKEDISKKPGG